MSGRARTERRRAKRKQESRRALKIAPSSSTRTDAPLTPIAASATTSGDARWRRLPTAVAARIFRHLGEFEDHAHVAQCCRTLRGLAHHPDASEPTQLALLIGRDPPRQFALRWVPHRLILRALPESRGDHIGVARLNHTFSILDRALANTRSRRRAFASIAFERFATDLVRIVDPAQLPPATDELVWQKMLDGSDGGDAHLASATLREWWRYVLANELRRVSFPFVDADDDLLPPPPPMALPSSSFSSRSECTTPRTFQLTALNIDNFYSCANAPALFAGLTDLTVREIEFAASFVGMCDAIVLRRLAVRRIAYDDYRTLCGSRGLARSLREFSLTLDRGFAPPYYTIDHATQRRSVSEGARMRHYNTHLFAPLAALSGLERLELCVPPSVALAISDYRRLARLTELRFLRLDVPAPRDSLRLPRLPRLVEFHAPRDRDDGSGGFVFSHLAEAVADAVQDDDADDPDRIEKKRECTCADPVRHADACRSEAAASVTATESRPLKFPSLQRLTCFGADRFLRDLPSHPALQTLHLCESRLDADDWRRFAATAARDFPSLAEVRGSDGKYSLPGM